MRLPNRRVAIFLGAALFVAWMVVDSLGSLVPQVASLFPGELPTNPYFVPQYGWLLYAYLPLVVTSALAVLMLPGVCLVLASGRASSWADVAVPGFGASYVLNVAMTSILKLVRGAPIDGAEFRVGLLVLATACWGVLFWRVRSRRGRTFTRTDLRRVLWTLAIVFVTLWALVPIIFWQDMNDDGFEALEIGRSVSRTYLPRWPFEPRVLGLGVGMVGMAYPVNWFVLLFGPIEASARLPLLLYLPTLFLVVIRIVERGSPREMRFVEEAALLFGLAVVTVTLAFNASYDPYFADIAAPTTFELLTVLCMLGAFDALRAGRDVWFLAYAVLGYLCRPTGLLVLGLFGIACLFSAKEEARRWLPRIGIAIALCLAVATAHEALYVPWVLGDAALGYGSASVLNRVRFVQFLDVKRLAFVIFPCGILPFVSLVAWKRHDSISRLLAIVAVAYFAFFYFQAFIALHHFVPVMVLPLAVFWRNHLHRRGLFGSWTLPAVFAASAVSLGLSLPTHFEVNRTVRPIGYRTAYNVGDYERDYDTVVRHAELLSELVPWDWDVADPSVELESSPNTIIYYATRPKPPGTEIDYVVQPLRQEPPSGFSLVASDDAAGLYVRDAAVWRRDRYQMLRTDFRSPLYYIPRETLFRHWGRPARNYTLDLRSVASGVKRRIESWFGISTN